MWNPEIFFKRKLAKVHTNAISCMLNFCGANISNSLNPKDEKTKEEKMIVGSYDCKVSIWELLENNDSVGYSKKNV